MNNIKHVVLDTNIYLHCKDIEHIDWCKLLHADAVEIIVPLIVLNEIDKHKDSHPVAKIKKRARAVSKKLYEYFFNSNNEEAVIKENVTISSYAPDVKPHDYGFEANRQDQYLIASILNLKEEHNQDIVLVSADNGALLLAKNKGIKAMRMPDKFRLPDEKTKDEKEIDKLKRELTSIKNVMPKLNVSINNNLKSPFRLKATTLEIPTPKSLEEIEAKYSPIATGKKGLGYLGTYNIERKYEEDYNKYISEYQQYLLTLESLRDLIIVEMNIVIVNQGGAPAKDIDISFDFPLGFCMFEHDKTEILPEEPTGPTLQQSILDSFINIPLQPSIDMSIGDSFSLKMTDHHEITDHIRSLKHGRSHTLPKLVLFFKADNLFNFKAGYKFMVGNIPNTIEGELNFIVENQIVKDL